ncbi:beta-alanyl-bioamine nonribosomal peptide synthetase ebony [Prorops nasuta]|uniref:beta-alanyl-bioamine nonribosomal peptide synthetase ebony n=1 Tax=Prorops nasuta TaxID=863751 RepID=UPI0034CDA2F6
MGTLQQLSVLKGLQTERKYKKLVHALFTEAASDYAKRTAILFEDENNHERRLTYEELDKITNKLARALKNYDNSKDKRQPLVAVCLMPSDRLPTILLAILKAGMAYLPLDAEFPSSRIKHVLREAEPLMVIVEKGSDVSIYEGKLCKTFEQILEEAMHEQEEPLELEDLQEQLAIVLYTSGSTGVPKGVLLPHATLLNRLSWQWRELPYDSTEERCVFKTSLTFVDSVPEIWGPLLQGRTLVVVPKHVTKDPERFVQVLQKHQIQRLVLVPSLLRSMLMYASLQDSKDILHSLRLWICSGESLPVALAEQFFQAFGDGNKTLANFYGSTEVMGDVTYHLINDYSQLKGFEKVPIGRPMDNCLIYLVNKEMQLVPQGEIGELLVAGRNLAAGYLRDRDSYKFLDNPRAIDPEFSKVFRTGDYARIVKGVVVYEGRVDSQIKVRGHRVDLAEVEKAVYRAPAVDKAVVLCYKPGELSQNLLAFVTIKEDISITDSQIENFLQNILPPYMLPRVIIVDHMPLLTNGKTDRQTLLRQYEALELNNDDYHCHSCDFTGVPVEDLPKAKVLFPTVASIIGRSKRATVTSSSNFYELGGNSLNSVYTVTKLRDQGYQIGITEFITSPTLAEVLRRMRTCSEDDVVVEKMEEDQHYFETLNDSHKRDAIQIVTESFYAKADLEQWLMPDVSREDYYEMMEALWPALVEKGLSFAVKSAVDDRTIGIGLNFDVWDEPELVLDSKLMIVFEFLDHLEAPIRETKLPKDKNQIIHSFMMTTSEDLSPAENVTVMGEMEEYCLRLAKEKNFIGIFTTNTSPLTQQLGTDVYGYETVLTYQVNKYVAPDGTKPFGKAPDNQVAICSLKIIN